MTLRDARKPARWARGMAEIVEEIIRNLFTHIIKCRICGASMNRSTKGKPPKGGNYLQCRNSTDRVPAGKTKKAICKAHSIRYESLEKVVIEYLKKHLDLQLFQDETGETSRLISKLRDRIETEKLFREKLESQIRNLTADVANESRMDLKVHLKNELARKLNEKIESNRREIDLKNELEVLIKESQPVKETIGHLTTLDALRDKARSENKLSELNRKIGEELQRMISHIKVLPIKDSKGTVLDGHPFESKDVSHIFIRFQYRSLTLVLKRV